MWDHLSRCGQVWPQAEADFECCSLGAGSVPGRFQAREAPHASPVLDPRCKCAPLASQADFVCMCFVSELTHLAPLLPPFLLFTSTSLNLSSNTFRTNYAIDRFSRFLDQMLKCILFCIKNNQSRLPASCRIHRPLKF